MADKDPNFNEDSYRNVSAEISQMLANINQINKKARELGREFNESGQDILGVNDNFNKTKTILENISKVSAETLGTQKGRKDLEKNLSELSKSQYQSETNIFILKEKIKQAVKAGNDQQIKDLAAILNLEQARLGIIEETVTATQKISDKTKEINKATQFFKSGEDFLKKIPGLGEFAGAFGAAAETMALEMANGATKAEAMAAALVKMNVVIAKIIALGLTKSLFKADQMMTDIAKNTNNTLMSAYRYKQEMAGTAALANDLRVNSQTIANASAALNDELGISLQYDMDRLVPLAKILDANVLNTKQAAAYNTLANSNNMTVKETLKASEDAVNAVNTEMGTRVSLKSVLEATANTTGQIRMQMGGSSEAISDAVTKAKSLGFELEQVAAAGQQLLNFEQSIESELEAELLTGKQLNLERARLAALTGDYQTLTEEINENVGDFSDFSKMNVLQQQALAKSVGMTADELSNVLFKQGDMKAMMDEAIANGDEQTIQQLEQLSNQEKFAKAVEQVKMAFVDLMGVISPITSIIGFIADIFSSLPGKIGIVLLALLKLGPILKLLRVRAIGTAIAKMFSGLPPPAGVALGLLGVTALMSAISKNVSKGDDVTSQGGYGKRQLYEEGQLTLLNDRDTLVAGTNLFSKGDDVVSKGDSSTSPNMNINIQNKSDVFANGDRNGEGVFMTTTLMNTVFK